MIIPELFNILKAISDETRYRILELLLKHDYCVRALAKRLNISESAVSQHLGIMRNAGIVRGDKRGYFTHYYVLRDSLKNAAEQIIQLSELPKTDTCCCESDSGMHSCHKRKGEIN